MVTEKVRHAAKAAHPTIYYNDVDGTGPQRPVTPGNFRVPVQSELTTAELDMNVVSPSYFNAMELSLVAGQEFTDHQMPGECRVGVINQEAADLYFGGKPAGAAVIDDQGVRTAIIGIVRAKLLGAFQQQAQPAIYFPMWQDCLPRMTLILGARQASGSMLADLRRRIELVPGRGRLQS